MSKGLYHTVACVLHIYLSGCMDYVKLEEDYSLNEAHRFAPVIDAHHLSPHPSRLIETIGVGKNCRGVIFQVPPIDDRNKKDRLHYLWFLDNKLVSKATIEPNARNSAIISFHINQHFLMSHFEAKIPHDFFNRRHVIDFFISDVEYTMPETRLTDDRKANEKEHSDYAYWIVSFNNDPC